MPNTAVPAAATGLPTGPRAFLRQLVAASALTVPVAAAAMAHSRPAIVEDPRLLALGADLDAAEAAWRTAEKLKRDVRARFDRICPTAPDELIDGRRHFYGADDNDWCKSSIARNPITGDSLYVVDRLAIESNVARYGPRTKLGRLTRQQRKMLLDYKEAKDEAAVSSGLEEAVYARDGAAADMIRLTRKICEIDALTVAGIALKARAILLPSEIEDRGEFFGAGAWFGRSLAENIIALGGGRADT